MPKSERPPLIKHSDKTPMGNPSQPGLIRHTPQSVTAHKGEPTPSLVRPKPVR